MQLSSTIVNGTRIRKSLNSYRNPLSSFLLFSALSACSTENISYHRFSTCIVLAGNNCRDTIVFTTQMNVFSVFRIAFTLGSQVLINCVCECMRERSVGTGFAFRSFWDQRWLLAKRTAENRAHDSPSP